ncbi:hypothetical protein [Roseateles sp. L2-2]|uniref:hypothetical protein n=1 Tax=Roseateles sp. L2-2 TaxID=3422597 RepID=UPI003D35ADC9
MSQSADEIAATKRRLVKAEAEALGASVGLPGAALERLIDYSGAISIEGDMSGVAAAPERLRSDSRVLRIIVRDDLLKPTEFFLSLLKDCISLSSAIGALFAGGPNAITVGAIASSVADLHDLFRKTSAYVHRLTPLQWSVIWELRLAKRASIDELAQRLPQIASKDIEATLRQFMISEQMPKNFTREREGQWELVGV